MATKCELLFLIEHDGYMAFVYQTFPIGLADRYGDDRYPQLWPRAPVFVVNSSLFGPHDLNQLHNRFLADGASTCFLDPFFNKERFPTEEEDDCLRRYDLLLAKLVEERKVRSSADPSVFTCTGPADDSSP